jgi:dihydrofolate reductase
VLSRSWKAAPPGFLLARSPEEALRLAAPAPEIMIAGGARVFAAFLPLAGRMYLTEIHHRFDGDTRFPHFDRTGWVERFREDRAPDDRNAWPLTFRILERAD